MSDLLNMSDDDFLRQGESLNTTPEKTEEESNDESVESSETEVDDSTGKNEESEEVESDTSNNEEIDEEAEEEESSADTSTDEKEEKSDEEKSDNSQTAEAQLAKLFMPFKANGREIKIESVEEAVALMQMGANYSKKMAGLKPNLRILKMLENNGLLSEEKLTYLIDLDKKNPDAINKLIKDSGVDPLSIDLDASPEYTPGRYQVSELEMEVGEVLDSIRDTNPTYYPNVLQVITSMDGASKSEISKDPKILSHLSDHMTNGIYDKVMAEVDKRKMLGQLADMPFIHAYYTVGNELHQQGKLLPKVVPPTTDPVAKVTKQNVKDNSSKKRAVANPRSTPTKPKSEFDPLAMSDEEFLQITNQKH